MIATRFVISNVGPYLFVDNCENNNAQTLME